ncbi:MAG TPA: arginine deiminase family protein [Jatrophihabitans sp.]|jgi:N-dimethylarginine dimethylaminohydrolase|uniref:arginine deiminase family protein n=1 Tax=Jatrophihabitans sp. TaxID=1932789 RepID=UPI002F24BAE9
MSVFNNGPSAFSTTRAYEEFTALTGVLLELGSQPLHVLDLTARIAVERLRVMAAAAVTQPSSRAEEVRGNLAAMPSRELVQLLVERPTLTLTPDAGLQEISPDSATESYTLAPLYGLMFPRDHLLQIEDLCFIASFRRDQRQAEAELVALSVEAAMPQLDLVRLDSFFEGGDAVACRERRVLFLSHGHRSDRRSALRIAAMIAGHGWSTVLLADRHRSQEEFHLDHWAAVVGDALLCEEGRVAGLREVEWVAPVGDGSPAGARLDEVLKSHGMTLLPVPRRVAGPYGFNVLDLADAGAVVCSDSAPAMAAVLRELGRGVVSVEFSTFESNFGSVHCATNELL